MVRPPTKSGVSVGFRVSLPIWIGASLLFGRMTGAEEGGLLPGKETGVKIPGTTLEMRVALPSLHSAQQKWPAVFYYAAMGEEPGVSFLQRMAGGARYLLVGMPYVEGSEKQRTPAEAKELIRKELDNLRAARVLLSQVAGLDEQAVYLSGVSRGGWMASALGEQDAARIAGLVILLAGRSKESLSSVTAGGLMGKAIYIGAGETDVNLLSARAAELEYRAAGALVTFDEYLGVGHQAPQEAKILKAWFEARSWARDRNGFGPAILEATGRLNEAAQEAQSATDPVARHQSLRDLANDPRLPFCNVTWKASLQNQLALVRQQSPVREEWMAETAFCRLATRQCNIRSLADLKAVSEGFTALSKGYGETRYGRRAAYYAEQFGTAYAKSVEASNKANAATGKELAARPGKSAVPTFPSGGSAGGQMTRTREGNRIIYKRRD